MTRGEIWWADLGLPIGSETGFRRPVLIVQANPFNASRIPTVIIVPLSTTIDLAEAPGNVLLHHQDTGLSRDSTAVVSQITALDRQRLTERVARVSSTLLETIDEGIRLVLGLR
jgi:mRNA interferase MazF